MKNTMIASTKESKSILDTIYKFGCIAEEQLPYFMPPTNRKTENYHVVVCNHLRAARLITKITDNAYCPFVNGQYSQAMIDSLWVMIDILDDGNAEIPMNEKMEVSFKAEYPETLCFIRDFSKTFKILPIETLSQIALIPFVQERFYASANAKPGDEINRKSLELILIREKSFLDEIKKLNLSIPYRIALLEGERDQKPTISYFCVE